MNITEFLDQRVTACRHDLYLMLLLFILIRFSITDFEIEVDPIDPNARTIKANFFLEGLSDEAQQEILGIQKEILAIRDATISEDLPSPITYYQSKQKFAVPGDFPALVDIVTHVVKKTEKQKNKEKTLPKEIVDRLTTSKFLQLPKIYLKRGSYKMYGIDPFAVIPMGQQELYGYLGLLIKSALAKNQSEIEQLWAEKSKTPVHLAAGFGDAELMKGFLREDKDKELTVRGRRPIHFACVFANVETLTVLIKHKAELNPKLNVAAPFYLAAKLGHTEILKELLITEKIGINATYNGDETAIFVACAAGNVECVRLLLECNADYSHIKDCLGRLPIHIACFYGQIDVVKMLLENDPAQVNFRTTNNETPLHFATLKGFKRLTNLLVNKYKANPVVVSYSKETALSHTKKLSFEEKDQMQKILGTGNASISYEEDTRFLMAVIKFAGKYLIPGGAYVILGDLSFLGCSLLGLGLIGNLIVSGLVPMIPTLIISKLGIAYGIPFFEKYFLDSAAQYAAKNMQENEDIENPINSQELSTYANVIPSIGKGENPIADTHIVLDLQEKKQLENLKEEQLAEEVVAEKTPAAFMLP